MVKNAEDIKDLNKVSFSFIPSLRCNMSCSFCMYKGSPQQTRTLDYEQTARFVGTVDWEKIVGWGLYGGEPSIDMELYQKFYELLPHGLRSFIITNGSWTKDYLETEKFLSYCAEQYHIIISGTPAHKANQNIEVVKGLAEKYPDAFTIKGDEELHPMGRLATVEWTCTKKCVWQKQPVRLGIFPTGHIILQNCDGVYPVVGHIDRDSFLDVFVKGQQIRGKGCLKNAPNINELLREK